MRAEKIFHGDSELEGSIQSMADSAGSVASRFGADLDTVVTQVSWGLGVFSIALGLAELLRARRVSSAIGSETNPTLLRLYGVREIAAGVGLLAARNKTPWLWSRVA